MPDLTKPFSKVFDAIRLVSQPIANRTIVPLRLYDKAGALLATITTGWFTDELSQEQSGGQRITELHVTARDGIDFTLAKFFGWGGYKYESKGFPNPPVNNPREWVFSVKPVGIDSVTTGSAIIARTGDALITRNGEQIIWR